MSRVVTFGEIMLRLSPKNNLRFSQACSFDVIYGGGESNVAVSLAHFEIDACYVTRLPNNDIGDACENYLRQYGVNTDHIVRGGDRLGNGERHSGYTWRQRRWRLRRRGGRGHFVRPELP